MVENEMLSWPELPLPVNRILTLRNLGTRLADVRFRTTLYGAGTYSLSHLLNGVMKNRKNISGIVVPQYSTGNESSRVNFTLAPEIYQKQFSQTSDLSSNPSDHDFWLTYNRRNTARFWALREVMEELGVYRQFSGEEMNALESLALMPFPKKSYSTANSIKEAISTSFLHIFGGDNTVRYIFHNNDDLLAECFSRMQTRGGVQVLLTAPSQGMFLQYLSVIGAREIDSNSATATSVLHNQIIGHLVPLGPYEEAHIRSTLS